MSICFSGEICSFFEPSACRLKTQTVHSLSKQSNVSLYKIAAEAMPIYIVLPFHIKAETNHFLLLSPWQRAFYYSIYRSLSCLSSHQLSCFLLVCTQTPETNWFFSSYISLALTVHNLSLCRKWRELVGIYPSRWHLSDRASGNTYPGSAAFRCTHSRLKQTIDDRQTGMVPTENKVQHCVQEIPLNSECFLSLS